MKPLMYTYLRYLVSDRIFAGIETSRLPISKVVDVSPAKDGHGTEYIFTISDYVFDVNLIDTVFRDVPEDVTDIDDQKLFFLTGYFTGVRQKVDGQSIGSTFIPAKGWHGFDRVWGTICKFDKIIDYAREMALVSLQETYFDDTTKYTSQRLANRLGNIWTTVERFAKEDLHSEFHPASTVIHNQYRVLGDMVGIDAGDKKQPGVYANIGELLYPKFPEKTGYPLSVSKRGLVEFKKIYDKYLKEVFQISDKSDEGEDPEFYTKVFVDYETPYTFSIYTQIGAASGIIGNEIEDWRFSLYVHPITLTCKYIEYEAGDEMEEVDLFSPDPRVIPEPTKKSALSIVMDNVFTEIINSDFELYKKFFTADDPGLLTDEKRTLDFVTTLCNKISRDYPPTKKQEGNLFAKCMKLQRREDGLTYIVIGSIFLVVAIDGIGIVDAALSKVITRDMTWDDVIYNVEAPDDKTMDELISDFDLVDWLDVKPPSAESECLLDEVCNLCASIFYQMSNDTEKGEPNG